MKQQKKRVCLSLELYATLAELTQKSARTVPNYIVHLLRGLFMG